MTSGTLKKAKEPEERDLIQSGEMEVYAKWFVVMSYFCGKN